MTSLMRGLEHDAAGWAWQSAPYAALVADVRGRIVRANDALRRLLPRAVPGAALQDAVPVWLARAHTAGVVTVPPPAAPDRGPHRHPPAGPQPACGVIGGRVFEARPVAGPDPGVVVWWLADSTEFVQLSGELEAERGRTAFLSEASNELLSSLNPDRCVEVVAALAARHLSDAAMVILPKEGHRYPVAYCGPGGTVTREKLAVDVRLVPGLAEALQGLPSAPSRRIDPAAVPAWMARDLGEPGSAMVTALPGQGVPAGALVLLRRPGRAPISEGDELAARLFAARAGAAISAARLYAEQAAVTETLTRELMPPRTQHLGGAELAARYRPATATDLVGGDFYDLHPAADPGGESLVVLGDVCGKGLEAAVLTGKIRNTLHALLPLAADHQRMLGVLNEVLLTGDRDRFVTMVLASVRGEDDRVRLRLTSAGHPPPLILRSGGGVESAPTQGTLVGMLDDITSTTATVYLEPGDTCLMYTDGITEAFGGPLGDEMFGEQRLVEELEGCSGMPPEALTERVQMLASEWVGGGDHDDMAVIAITAPRATAGGGTAPAPRSVRPPSPGRGPA
ncbi:PP2C family protein-serine/threonine phosphatase [Nonomuraea pusilla]|nr:PP2C family protein-serine/threonine phosphatase [Nonomuraea pusilla]